MDRSGMADFLRARRGALRPGDIGMTEGAGRRTAGLRREEVAAAVVLKEGATATEAELVAHCKEKLADFKRPKQIFITAAIPRTATGKIQRSRVAEAFAGAAQ